MKFIDKLERKFGKYGIPNLTVYVCACYVIGYLLELFNPGIMSMLSLDMAKVFQGQIWRLVTWVLYPPSSGNLILFIIMIFFFYYPIGTSLERTWGTFRYTLYIFSGIIFICGGLKFDICADGYRERRIATDEVCPIFPVGVVVFCGFYRVQKFVRDGVRNILVVYDIFVYRNRVFKIACAFCVAFFAVTES